uniref:Uncharacterized protein n=1 Tax=Anguilla anguilla TaxID=7936 RepID=A0A0E9RZ72_ANGAN
MIHCTVHKLGIMDRKSYTRSFYPLKQAMIVIVGYIRQI